MLFILCTTSLVYPVVSQTNLEQNTQSDRVYVHGIGIFEIYNEEIILSGTIFIGFRGTKPIFNEEIVITADNLIFIIASKHFIQAIIRV